MIRILLALSCLLPVFTFAQTDTIARFDEQQTALAVFKGPDGIFYTIEMSDDVEEDSFSLESAARRGSLNSCVTAQFTGVMRRAVKTTPQPGWAKSYKTLDDLFATLPSDSAMIHRVPKIDRSASSKRVAEEQRNVRLKKVWLFAAFRESDNDFHLIIGNHQRPDSATIMMNVEVSGLPERRSIPRRYYKRLLKTRTDFIKIFGDTQCRRSFRFKDKGAPVEIKGSLFFDIHHASTGTGSGKLRPSSVWEIHPITGIKWLTQ